jgi:aspartyl-tRNA(Asn)/glutamyl-tRNA(Gln) amidotransferase subunit A
MTSSNDVPGPITKTVEDARFVMNVIAGHDEYDATTADVPVDLKEASRIDLKGVKIGWPIENDSEGLSAGVKKALQESKSKLIELGAEIIDITLPYAKYAIPVYYIITPSEISSNLARFDGVKYGFSAEEAKELKEVYTKSRGQGFGKEVKRRIMLGTYALSAGYRDAYYLKAQKVRTKIKEELDGALKEVDVILTPTQPTTAYKIGAYSADPLQMYLEDAFVAPASMAGLPAISIPCGLDNDLPIGLQIIGPRFGEGKILEIAAVFENNTEHHHKRPII